MVKLKSLSFHNVENVPDHILQEMQEFSAKLVMAIMPLIESASPNIALMGIEWAHAVILKHLITEIPGELEKAARMSAKTLLNNIQILINEKSQ